MSNINENIKRFTENHFGTGKSKVPVQVFVMQIHEDETEEEEEK
ncbi:hypothetical protein [Bacillus salipaludis]|nr:hypothetical protein [Bacillus salipaludis]